jgi:hypothetical protein
MRVGWRTVNGAGPSDPLDEYAVTVTHASAGFIDVAGAVFSAPAQRRQRDALHPSASRPDASRTVDRDVPSRCLTGSSIRLSDFRCLVAAALQNLDQTQ